MKVIHCEGHIFRVSTSHQDLSSEYFWICTRCGLKVKTKEAKDYLTGLMS